MGKGRPRGVRIALLTAGLLALAGPARAGGPGPLFDVGIGPYRDLRYTNTEGNIPGTPRNLAPAYGYYPYYSYSWPSLREALALKRAGLTPCDVPRGPARNAVPPPAAAAPAALRVLVPAGAELWIGESPTAQRGAERQFISPPLEGGRNLVYELRARWTERGRAVERTRAVRVFPGDRVTVDFLAPPTEVEPLPAPRRAQGP